LYIAYFSVIKTFCKICQDCFEPHSFSLGMWAHGDYCKINPKTGGIVMLGRRSAVNLSYFQTGELVNIQIKHI